MSIDREVTERVAKANEDGHLVQGIHFGLAEDVYHAVPALGSTDIKRVRMSASDYWWNSWMNPDKEPDKDTPARLFGRAAHAMLLYGPEYFGRHYVRRPPDLSRLTEKARAEIAPNGEDVLYPADYDRIIDVGVEISSDPNLETAFSNGYAEVSLFWRDEDGTPLKARYDYMKLRGIGDLKTTRNTRNIDFAESCRRAIYEYRYDIQAAHYMRGRRRLQEFVGSGQVFGEVNHEWLQEAADAKEFAFQFVFFQSEDAPNVWSTVLSPGNPIIEYCNDQIDEALRIWRRYFQEFGTNRWRILHEVSELDASEMPAWAYR